MVGDVSATASRWKGLLLLWRYIIIIIIIICLYNVMEANVRH